MILSQIKKLQPTPSTSQLRTPISAYMKLALLLSFLMMPMECFAAEQGQGDFYHLYWSEFEQGSKKREGVYVHKNSTPHQLRNLLLKNKKIAEDMHFIELYTKPLGDRNKPQGLFINSENSDDSKPVLNLVNNRFKNDSKDKPKLISINDLNGKTVYYSGKVETVSIQQDEPLLSQDEQQEENDDDQPLSTHDNSNSDTYQYQSFLSQDDQQSDTNQNEEDQPFLSQNYRNSNNDQSSHTEYKQQYQPLPSEQKQSSFSRDHIHINDHNENIEYAHLSTSDNEESSFSKKLSGYAKNRYVQGLLGLSAVGVAAIIFYQAFLKSQKKGNNRKKKKKA